MPEIVRLDIVDSTQEVAFSLAECGAVAGTVVVADSQRAGRGRRGRVWRDEPGASLLCSILLRPRIPAVSWPLLSLAAGVAVARALGRVAGVDARLKWPNDVVIAGRKVAGILLESRGRESPAVVIGIGINVGQRSFPADLEPTATSLRLARGAPVDREALLRTVLEELATWCERLEGEGFAPVRDAWKAMSATIGTTVRAEAATGRAVDLDADGALVIDDGRRRHRLVAGELIEEAAGASRR
jgi:BirA family biotin operon repressor/biotin-[acetyl-CoA-carboxylase] ligase